MSSSELHLLYVLGTISLMLGLTERPVIAPYAIAIEYADQHIPVLRLPMDAPILPGSQGLVKVLGYSPLELSAIGSVIRRNKDGLEKRGKIARAVRSERPAPREMSHEQS